MQVDFCIPPSDGNGGWNLKKAKFKKAVLIEEHIDEYVRFIDFMVDKSISIERQDNLDSDDYLIVNYDYQITQDGTTYLRVYIVKKWD